MEKKKKSKKISKWVIVVLIALALLIGAGLYLLWGLKDYMDKVPKITPKETVTVQTGQTLAIEDLFDVECKGEYRLSLSISETEIPDAEISADKQSVYVGSTPGEIRIIAGGSGEVAEYAESENVIVVMEKE